MTAVKPSRTDLYDFQDYILAQNIEKVTEYIRYYGSKIVNAHVGNGLNSLHHAAQRNNEKMIRLLLQHGADPLALEISEQTPRDYAVMYKFHAIAKILEEAEQAIVNAAGKQKADLAASEQQLQKSVLQIEEARTVVPKIKFKPK